MRWRARVHALAVELRVGTRDVDELEEAELRVAPRRSGSSARRSRRSRPSRRARRRGRSARRRCRARRVSLASTQPPSVRPSTSGRKPLRSRTPNRCASSISTSENAPARRGQHLLAARARGRGRRSAASSSYSRASSSPISSLSEVSTPGSMPSSPASSSVLVRLPLWPSAKPASATDRYTGCALRHVLEPVVE